MVEDTSRPIRLELTPLAGNLGAKVIGLDLSQPVDAATMAELRDAFLRHLVLVLPGQAHITPAQQVAFAAQWGELHRMPARTIEGEDALTEIATRGGRRRFQDAEQHETVKLARTDVWHSDVSYEPCPPMGTVLLARQLPPAGGDTMFSNQYLAFETLSQPMQAFLQGLRALHSGEGYFRLVGLDPRDAPRTSHPVVRTHPETGRQALYVNRIWTRHIEGLGEDESKVLLDFIYEHAVQPQFTFRHTWSEGDLLMWDNRCTQHYAIHDYGDTTRIMHRATILGDAPYFRRSEIDATGAVE